ncbi:MAG: sigma 54-interacting transcriptional regulator [Polyangiaceae bacterium]
MGTRPGAPSTAEHRAPKRPAASVSRPALLVAFPRPAGLPFEIGEPLGRDWLADHDVPDYEVSGRHFELGREGSRFRIRDVGSRNGTWLDGRPLIANEWQSLEDGAVLRLGSTLLVFREALVGPLAPAPPVGALVGPYGLRHVAASLATLAAHPPGNVLILGETGAGKELAARAVAEALDRAHPYAAVNVAGVASGVFESQLFGHVAGAFSDARKAARGIIASHEGGTVFLDELGELPLDLQPKLLRLLENRELLPVGAERPHQVDILLVAATNRDLAEMVAQDRFRQDLLARLEANTLELPPLRQRSEDVFPIARHLAPTLGQTLAPDHCEVEAVERLLLDPWPTNVRGLQATLSKLRTLDPEPGLHLWSVENVLGPAPSSRRDDGLTPERLQQALEASGGNESQAARHLGITRGKLRRLLGK